MKHNRKLLGDKMRRVEVKVDNLRVAAAFEISTVKLFARELEDRGVGTEVLDEFNNTAERESKVFEFSSTKHRRLTICHTP